MAIALPETTDCNASGAICTGDGRPLSRAVSATVSDSASFPAVSVSDASATEGDAIDVLDRAEKPSPRARGHELDPRQMASASETGTPRAGTNPGNPHPERQGRPQTVDRPTT